MAWSNESSWKFPPPPEVKSWLHLWFEVTQNWIKTFHLAEIWTELLLFGQSQFSLLEFTQIFPIYGNILGNFKIYGKNPNFSNFWKRTFQPKLNEVVRNCSNFIKVVKMYPNVLKWFWFHPNLNKTLVTEPDISERTKILRVLFYIAHLWTRCLKLPTIEWSCCKLAKFGLTDGLVDCAVFGKQTSFDDPLPWMPGAEAPFAHATASTRMQIFNACFPFPLPHARFLNYYFYSTETNSNNKHIWTVYLWELI